MWCFNCSATRLSTYHQDHAKPSSLHNSGHLVILQWPRPLFDTKLALMKDPSVTGYPYFIYTNSTNNHWVNFLKNHLGRSNNHYQWTCAMVRNTTENWYGKKITWFRRRQSEKPLSKQWQSIKLLHLIVWSDLRFISAQSGKLGVTMESYLGKKIQQYGYRNKPRVIYVLIVIIQVSKSYRE